MKSELSDEQVDREIDLLNRSPLVKLARREQRLKYVKRQRLYQLRWMEKRGRQLQADGITMEILETMARAQRERDLFGDEPEDEDSIF